MARPAAAHVFVDDLERCVLSEDDAHHLFSSLRLRPGEAVSVSDGKGRWRLCRVGGRRGADELETDGPITEVPRPAPPLTVGFALTKGGRPDQVVQRLTELGVDQLVPLATARSVVRWSPADAGRHVERLRRVARAAAMQSRLAHLPEVSPLVDLRQVSDLWPPDQLALAHPGGRPISLEQRVVLVGPEGGWEPAELETGLATVDLGPTRLRADTAAIAVGVLLTALRGGAVRPIDGDRSALDGRGGAEAGGPPGPGVASR
ncbi:MAG: 16S rRNA (uracil(1498)-N(3))-methyltransferase [Acidimicrobiales bacterium]|nr:16S rRNA (uracil(1498)-N(3))-methyltransferase [Acidimicrobiales bacterium]MBO0894259.1 16S rRNA (uracil(1498)-N(3))-methyltransferase [Acidimicrobiales bacterium]